MWSSPPVAYTSRLRVDSKHVAAVLEPRYLRLVHLQQLGHRRLREARTSRSRLSVAWRAFDLCEHGVVAGLRSGLDGEQFLVPLVRASARFQSLGLSFVSAALA
jgi:hypothetical protein